MNRKTNPTYTCKRCGASWTPWRVKNPIPIHCGVCRSKWWDRDPRRGINKRRTEITCRVCQVTKPCSSFYRDKKGVYHIICKTCANVKKKEWYYKNRDYCLRYAAKFRADNPDKVRESDRRWRSSHRAYVNATYNKWRAAHVGGDLTPKEWIAMLNITGHKCLCCGKSGLKLSMDHITPLSKGGKHSISNVQPLCIRCNSKKLTKDTDYRQNAKSLIACVKRSVAQPNLFQAE